VTFPGTDNCDEIRKIIAEREIFIFDFDGVLVDSVHIKTEAFRELFAEYGEDVSARVVQYHLKNKGVSRFDKLRYYHRELLCEQVDDAFLAERAHAFSKIVLDKVVASDEIEGAVEFLRKYAGSKTCFANSATPQDEMQVIIERRGWSHYFDKVYGAPVRKADNLKMLMRRCKATPSDCIFFGDASADLAAATEIGTAFVAINYEGGAPDNIHELQNFSCLLD